MSEPTFPTVDVSEHITQPKRLLQYGWWAWESHKMAEGYQIDKQP